MVMRHFYYFALIFGLLLTACDNNSIGNSVNGVVAPQVQGAKVEVYTIDSAGSVSEKAYASTISDQTGRYTIDVPANGSYIIKASGGTSLDFGNSQPVISDTPFRVLGNANDRLLVISCFSEAAVRLANAPGPLTTDAIIKAKQAITSYLLGVDPTKTEPRDPTNSSAMQTATASEKTFAAAFGAITHARSTLGWSLETIVREITSSITVGKTLVASHGGASYVLVKDGKATEAGTGGSTGAIGGKLATSFSAFVSGNSNQIGVKSVSDIAPIKIDPNDDTNCTTDAGNDFDYRYSQPETDSACSDCGSWGPHARQFSGITCQDIGWQQARIQKALFYWTAKGLNYCHHHIPAKVPSQSKYAVSNSLNTAMNCTANRYLDGSQVNNDVVNGKVITNPDGTSFVCTNEVNNCVPSDILAKIQWQGVDCSDFSSWIYNFTMGIMLQTAIADQACNATANAGILLDINHTNVLPTAKNPQQNYMQYLQPGDLLYIMDSGNTKMNHVVFWTGMAWKDIKNDTARVGGDYTKYTGGKEPTDDTPVIVDSHYAGPAYRPFAGWYVASLSHVRRILNIAATQNDPNLSKLIMKSIQDPVVTTQYKIQVPGATDHYLQYNLSADCFWKTN